MARDNGPPLLENPKSILDGMTHLYMLSYVMRE